MTLQILFHPALNALGKPQITVRNSLFGAILMPAVYLFAVQYGATGLAAGWLIAFPSLLLFTFYQARKHIGISAKGLFASIWPGLLAASCMAAMLWLFDHYILRPFAPMLPAPLHLLTLTVIGAASYVAMLWYGAQETFIEVVNLVVKRKPPTVAEPITL
jgi:O-antigen/teichoic acid export membrane protein